MATWQHVLDRAGITTPALREDYTLQRRLIARFERAPYLAVRLLLPDSVVPHVVAATAFMHHSDNILDQGSPPERVAAFADWEKAVRTALETGVSDSPVLRALLNTAEAYPRLPDEVEQYLTGAAPHELHFHGFATEADFQAYVDGYSLPAFMLVAGLLAPWSDEYRALARTFIEAWQRLDFLDDLAEDLHRDSRLGLPADALARHGVTRSDLEAARPTDGVRALLRETAGLIGDGLRACHPLAGLVPAPNRPLVRALIALQELRLTAVRRSVEKSDLALLHGSARLPVVPALWVLAREYAGRRRRRRGPQLAA
jgi:phytoene synthase